MPKNLDQKIALILDDVESLPRSEAIRRFKALIEDELKFIEMEHILTPHDLANIRSSAILDYNNRDVAKEVEKHVLVPDMAMIQALCYAYSVVGFLREKDLIAFTLKFNKRGKR